MSPAPAAAGASAGGGPEGPWVPGQPRESGLFVVELDQPGSQGPFLAHCEIEGAEVFLRAGPWESMRSLVQITRHCPVASLDDVLQAGQMRAALAAIMEHSEYTDGELAVDLYAVADALDIEQEDVVGELEVLAYNPIGGA